MAEKLFTQEEANQFIIDCHTDLETVRSKVSHNPALVNAYNPATVESALGAAGHMGQRKIAEFLMDQGAQPELATLAMLGRYDEVANRLAEDPGLAKSGGAHNIPVAFHAAISGNTSIMQLLWDAGAHEQVKNALFGAVAFNQVGMVRWLLDRGARTEQKSPNGKTVLELAQARGLDDIVALLVAVGQ